MNSIIIATAAAGFLYATPTEASLVIQAPAARVGYADLNLQSQAGRLQLLGRIRSAAQSLCIEPNIDPLPEKLIRMECYQTAVGSGLSQLETLSGGQAAR
jgi:UrcA family protein